MALEFNNCCFCIELRTGSLIIGYLSLVGNLILTLTLILGISGAAYVAHENKEEENKAAVTVAIVILVIALILVLINLLFNILLLVGVHKNQSGKVKAYLIYTGIFIGLSIIMFISRLVTKSNANAIAGDLITIVLSIYFLLCIRSHYLKMNDPSKRPAIYNTA